MIAVLVVALVIVAVVGLPLFLVLGGGSLIGYLSSDLSPALFIASCFRPVATNSLFLAIPLFTFAGYLMSESKAPQRLVRLSRATVGWMPGGLAMVAIAACAGFTAFTGASGVTIVALGGLLMPALLKDGYPPVFSLGLLTSGGSRGILLPPSLPLIVYAMIAGLSMEGVESSENAPPPDETPIVETAAAPSAPDAAPTVDDGEDEAAVMARAAGKAPPPKEPAAAAPVDDEDEAAVMAKAAKKPPATPPVATAPTPVAAAAPMPAEPSEPAEAKTPDQVSVNRLFVAGAFPAALALLVAGAYAAWIGIRKKVPRTRFSWKELGGALWEAAWEIPIPILIVVGIYGGYFTAIDASAITVAYVFIVEVLIYRDIKWRDLARVCRESMVLVGAILLIIMSALALTNFFLHAEVPQKLFAMVKEHISSPLTFLIVLNLFLLVVGCLMDIFSAILVVVPIITPVALHFGINPIHLGIIFLTNLEIGYNTPPVGVNLFVGSLAFRRPMTEMVKSILPFLVLSILVLIVVSYWPDLSLALVRWTGVK
jgi:TRAP-type C4-dicarboxylate transport system permease large subunit